MKRLDLQQSIESFALFDWLMVALAVLGLIVAVWSYYLGGGYRAFTLLMVFCECILIYGAWLAPRRLSVTTLRQSLVQSPSVWVKIVFISDLHAGSHLPGPWFEKVVTTIEDLRPDMILAAGDFVVSHADEMKNVEMFSRLKTPYGNFFVLGNHDYLDDPGAVRSAIKRWGFTDLTNSDVILKIQGAELRLTGLDDALHGKPMILSERQIVDAPRLTMVHSPDALLDFKEGQTDLVLCGHSHGGQIRFPYFGCLGVPSKLGCRADQGMKIINGIKTYISRGLGEVGCRARLLCRPEITLIELGI